MCNDKAPHQGGLRREHRSLRAQAATRSGIGTIRRAHGRQQGPEDYFAGRIGEEEWYTGKKSLFGLIYYSRICLTAFGIATDKIGWESSAKRSEERYDKI